MMVNAVWFVQMREHETWRYSQAVVCREVNLCAAWPESGPIKHLKSVCKRTYFRVMMALESKKLQQTQVARIARRIGL
jgi:hypothetical protein